MKAGDWELRREGSVVSPCAVVQGTKRRHGFAADLAQPGAAGHAHLCLRWDRRVLGFRISLWRLQWKKRVRFGAACAHPWDEMDTVQVARELLHSTDEQRAKVGGETECSVQTTAIRT